MVVVYATAADEVAQDGQGRNSPFTTALLRRLQEPGLAIEMMFRRVAADVNAQTGGRPRPETTISLLSEYYLNQNDRLVWDGIKNQDDVAALRDFVNTYPSSPYAIIARNRLELLKRLAREEDARRAREEEQLRREAEERLRAEQDTERGRAEGPGGPAPAAGGAEAPGRAEARRRLAAAGRAEASGSLAPTATG
jgi:Caspase domain